MLDIRNGLWYVLVYMQNTVTNTSTRSAAMYGLAVIGFAALVGAGMWLAVYSSRFVPEAVGRIGSAAASLSAYFTPSPDTSLSVVPAASTTIPFGGYTPVPPASTTDERAPATAVTPTAGPETDVTAPMSDTASVPLSGRPDLVTFITAKGYLATSSTNSFVAADIIPAGSRPAVRFTIKNIGTNATGMWRFSASIPTQTAFIYQSIPQQSLNPGDSIDYTLGFDQANRGSNQTISVTADFERTVSESNEDNNSASTKLIMLGS